MGRPRRGTWTLLGWFLAVTLVGSVGIRELLQNELALVNDSERHLRSLVLSSDFDVFEERDSLEPGERLHVHVPDSTWSDGTRIGF